MDNVGMMYCVFRTEDVVRNNKTHTNGYIVAMFDCYESAYAYVSLLESSGLLITTNCKYKIVKCDVLVDF